MLRYETLLLTPTEITDGDLSMIEKYFDQLVTDANGKFESFDKWGKYRLAYPVEKHNHGIYILVRYQLPAEVVNRIVTEMDRFLKIKCHEIILRHVNIRLRANAQVAYQKPEPMDVARTGSLDTFLKENKIETLLHSVDAANNHDDDDIINNEEHA